MTNNTLIAWIKDLNEDYLADWANRGLLRRGRKLAESQDASICVVAETGYQAEIEGQQQTLEAPSFEHLNCS